MTNRALDFQSNSTTLTNTTTETVLGTLTVPAYALMDNAVGVGGALRVGFGGTMTCTTDSITAVFRAKMTETSTATIAETSAVAMSTSANPHNWWMGGTVLAVTSNSQKVWSGLGISSPSTQLLAPSSFGSVGYSTLGFDIDSPITVTMTAQFNTATANVSLTREMSVLESLR